MRIWYDMHFYTGLDAIRYFKNRHDLIKYLINITLVSYHGSPRVHRIPLRELKKSTNLRTTYMHFIDLCSHLDIRWVSLSANIEVNWAIHAADIWVQGYIQAIIQFLVAVNRVTCSCEIILANIYANIDGLSGRNGVQISHESGDGEWAWLRELESSIFIGCIDMRRNTHAWC